MTKQTFLGNVKNIYVCMWIFQSKCRSIYSHYHIWWQQNNEKNHFFFRALSFICLPTFLGHFYKAAFSKKFMSLALQYMWIDQPYLGLVRDVIKKQLGATNHTKEAAKKTKILQDAFPMAQLLEVDFTFCTWQLHIQRSEVAVAALFQASGSRQGVGVEVFFRLYIGSKWLKKVVSISPMALSWLVCWFWIQKTQNNIFRHSNVLKNEYHVAIFWNTSLRCSFSSLTSLAFAQLNSARRL